MEISKIWNQMVPRGTMKEIATVTYKSTRNAPYLLCSTMTGRIYDQNLTYLQLKIQVKLGIQETQ